MLRPWFDWLALRLVTRWYFPLSRAWAAARFSKGDFGSFSEEFSGRRFPREPTSQALRLVKRNDERHTAADRAWRHLFFGAEEVGNQRLVLAEMKRQRAANNLMLSRFAFTPLRRFLTPVRWNIADRAEVERKHGPRLIEPSSAFALPKNVEVERSRDVAGFYGREYWLRFPSPGIGDTAWARVIEPEGAVDPPTFLVLHGIGMETEMWREAVDPVSALAQRGLRVMRLEGPWHGRRMAPGTYGGEPILSQGPMGLLDFFKAWIVEAGILIDWARRQGSRCVGIGGVSLGALTSQLLATVASSWPESARPDSLVLVATSGDLVRVAYEGAIPREIGLPKILRRHGWSHEDMTRWLPLLEPQGRPVMAPEQIILLLGRADEITPFESGLALAQRWGVPAENRFVHGRGHFSVSLGLLRDKAPLERLLTLLDIKP